MGHRVKYNNVDFVVELFVQKISTPMSYLRSSAENVLRKCGGKRKQENIT